MWTPIFILLKYHVFYNTYIKKSSFHRNVFIECLKLRSNESIYNYCKYYIMVDCNNEIIFLSKNYVQSSQRK